jgi:hypothetical protein
MTVRQELVRAKNVIANLRARWREEGQRMTRVGVNGTLAVGGGATAGLLRSKFPVIPGTEVPTDAVLGGVALVAAATDLVGEYGDELSAFGGGLLAARACTVVENALK